MSVIIKGMKMPTSCSECALNYDCFKCIIMGTPFFDHEHNFDDETTRLDNCPLISIPSHGRLIDADDLLTDKSMNIIGKGMIFGGQYVFSESEIINAPTVIEAEEGET